MFSTTAIANPGGPEDDCAGAIPAPGPVFPCEDKTPTGPLGGCTSGLGTFDKWVSFIAPGTSTRIRTDIGSIGTDSDFIVWDACPPGGNKIGCGEDIGPGNYLSDTCVGGLTLGATYYVQVGSWADSCSGPYAVDISAAGTCGDGILDCGEGCDDSNTTGGDCCSATCQNEFVCGDSVICGTETCDDGNTTNGDGCNNLCHIEVPFCGDNMVNQTSEECDGTAGTCASGSYCGTNCLCIEGIPAVSEWGLAVLTLIGLVSGTILFGRRRAAAH
jgi:cysteine-rich repeat protein